MRRNTVSQFIETIWEIVSDPDSDEIICWNPHGTSFSILDTDLFASNIIPKHFNHSNLSSFIRQLNMYNFHKNKTKTVGLEFHHKLFRRGAKELLIGIKRKPSEADAREGEQLLKSYLVRMGASCQQKSITSNDDRKEDSYNSTIGVEGNKLLLVDDDKDRKFEAKIIRNVPVSPQLDNLN